MSRMKEGYEGFFWYSQLPPTEAVARKLVPEPSASKNYNQKHLDRSLPYIRMVSMSRSTSAEVVAQSALKVPVVNLWNVSIDANTRAYVEIRILAQRVPDLQLQCHSGVRVPLEIDKEIGIDHRIPAIRPFRQNDRRPEAGVIDVGPVAIPGKREIMLVKREKGRSQTWHLY